MKRTRKSKVSIAPTGTQSDTKEKNSQTAQLPPIALPAFLSAIALWASFAPLGLSLVAWVAPMGWLVVIERDTSPGKRGYFWLYLSGFLFWMLNLQGIRLAFWALIFGWIALSVYLAIYVPLFVGVTRTLRFAWRWPLFIAAPVTWVGLEVARSFIITGYAASLLGHTQAHQPIVIQIADQLGGYGVSFLIMAVNVAVFQIVTSLRHAKLTDLESKESQPKAALVPALFALTLLLASLGYGWWRLKQADQLASTSKPLLRVALLQENTPTIFDSNTERIAVAWARYLDLTREAAQQHGVADLVVWPESTFTNLLPWTEVNITNGVPQDLLKRDNTITEEQLAYGKQKSAAEFKIKLDRVLAAARNESVMQPPATPIRDRPYLLLGCDALTITSQSMEQFNSAIFFDPAGTYQDRYDKMHLVMFGEYIPLGPVLQFLADAFQVGSIQAGKDVKCFDIAGTMVAPNICFESMLPELVSWQIRKLIAENRAPDVLINVTNDSWFWGSSILDHHLACSIFCAVENRRPFLVAANTGLSAEIDGSGRVLQVSQRLTKTALLAEPRADGRRGMVQTVGYPLAWLCCAIVAAAIIVSFAKKLSRPR
ncbi:MAG: apolipoprotein N-acyltransferase [Pirellulaceae bacterium]|nr:apolipoprotein N-acyltransferase [Pirellulaceae bacterium]